MLERLRLSLITKDLSLDDSIPVKTTTDLGVMINLWKFFLGDYAWKSGENLPTPTISSKLNTLSRYTPHVYPTAVHSPYCAHAEHDGIHFGWCSVARKPSDLRFVKKDILPVVNLTTGEILIKPVLFKGLPISSSLDAEPTGITAIGSELVLTSPIAFVKWKGTDTTYTLKDPYYVYDYRGNLIGANHTHFPRCVFLARPAQLIAEDKRAILSLLGIRNQHTNSVAV